MNAGEWRVITGWSRPRSYQPATKFFAPSQLRRMRGSRIEFLLVQTRAGRWTFPKGSAEPGLTHAQAAALEAFEEAGVHGRMEEAAFTSYTRRAGGSSRRSGGRSAAKELVINAHLCEVVRFDPPLEKDRNPTWFSALQAKR